MACIKSAPRSALVAFAPDAPYLAAGTMAGAVDLFFSSSANLEIFKIDFRADSHELPVVGVCSSSERFNRLSWGKPGSGSEKYSLGLVAGGLGDGSICVWNPLTLIGSDNPDSALLARLEKHTGPKRSGAWNSVHIHPICLLLGLMKGNSAYGIWPTLQSLIYSHLSRVLALVLKLKFLLCHGIPSFNIY